MRERDRETERERERERFIVSSGFIHLNYLFFKKKIQIHSRCIHTLGWHVNEAVLSKGGVVTDSSSSMSTDSLHEKLVMTVQVPYLFGVPQEWDAIR